MLNIEYHLTRIFDIQIEIFEAHYFGVLQIMLLIIDGPIGKKRS